MKSCACILHGAHDLRMRTVPVPSPGPGEVKISILAGGICGTDLHYFHDGGFGPIRVREPIILGHEAAGHVTQVGRDVIDLTAGDLVAINPSQPCGQCTYCIRSEEIHCLDMRFMGSAYRVPHEQGLFRNQIVVPARQVHRYTNTVTPQEAACAEPLAVCLHARAQAPSLRGKKVLITGSGPIGVLCAAVSAQAGASEVVVTDLYEVPLDVARQMGATQTINLTAADDCLSHFKQDKGYFDVVFECSAAPAAIKDALNCLRPRGNLILVGVAGETPIPLNLIVSKEVAIKGTHRFHEEFASAVLAINTGVIDVKPMITASFPAENAVEAFKEAGNRKKAMKVHLIF